MGQFNPTPVHPRILYLDAKVISDFLHALSTGLKIVETPHREEINDAVLRMLEASNWRDDLRFKTKSR